MALRTLGQRSDGHTDNEAVTMTMEMMMQMMLVTMIAAMPIIIPMPADEAMGINRYDEGDDASAKY